jgi:hypothetical protein
MLMMRIIGSGPGGGIGLWAKCCADGAGVGWAWGRKGVWAWARWVRFVKKQIRS